MNANYWDSRQAKIEWMFCGVDVPQSGRMNQAEFNEFLVKQDEKEARESVPKNARKARTENVYRTLMRLAISQGRFMRFNSACELLDLTGTEYVEKDVWDFYKFVKTGQMHDTDWTPNGAARTWLAEQK